MTEHKPNGPRARPPTVVEETIYETWHEAITKSFDSTDGAAETILTASFSIATAYGALISLVSPENAPRPVYLGVPFIFFAAAALAALAARTKALAVRTSAHVEDIENAIQGTVGEKRAWAWRAIAALVIAILWAGVVVTYAYADTSDSPKTTALVKLNAQGQATVGSICSGSASGLRGDFELDGDLAVITLAGAQCGSARKIMLPKTEVTAVLVMPAT